MLPCDILHSFAVPGLILKQEPVQQGMNGNENAQGVHLSFSDVKHATALKEYESGQSVVMLLLKVHSCLTEGTCSAMRWHDVNILHIHDHAPDVHIPCCTSLWLKCGLSMHGRACFTRNVMSQNLQIMRLEGLLSVLQRSSLCHHRNLIKCSDAMRYLPMLKVMI